MEITEVRIKLMVDLDDRLQAFCSITFDDCFVVRDLKIIEGANGPFVAMPSRKLTSHCPSCHAKNHLRAVFCNQCGSRLPEEQHIREEDGRAKLYADIAHPINSQCREMIQNRVIAEYRAELELAKQPGYVSRYDDDFEDDVDPAHARPRVTAPEPNRTNGSTRRAGERTQIQPAEPQPRPPHMVPAPSHVGASRRSRRRNDDFGAGIF